MGESKDKKTIDSRVFCLIPVVLAKCPQTWTRFGTGRTTFYDLSPRQLFLNFDQRALLVRGDSLTMAFSFGFSGDDIDMDDSEVNDGVPEIVPSRGTTNSLPELVKACRHDIDEWVSRVVFF